ncbi:MAG: dTDP-6-deoxy-3,4-keto-hexulose isomerase, partial [Candidatus Pacebacteria bacterium CG10_big_fil_rev_8_21_14_0_10_44_54]
CVLDSPDRGILLDKMVWHEMHDIDDSTILLVLASQKYDESDYIRSYEKFKEII